MEIVKAQEILDTYLNISNCVNDLIDNFNKYGRLIVAYDFDDTVKPGDGYCCDQVVELLQECSKYSELYMICFTCRSSKEDLKEAADYLDELDIRHDKINENAPDIDFKTSNKILFSIFLDNRAGLQSAYITLSRFLIWLKIQKGETTDTFDLFDSNGYAK